MVAPKSFGTCLGAIQRNQSKMFISFCSELVSLDLLNFKCRKALEFHHALVHFQRRHSHSQRVQHIIWTLAQVILLMPLLQFLPLWYLGKVLFPLEMPFACFWYDKLPLNHQLLSPGSSAVRPCQTTQGTWRHRVHSCILVVCLLSLNLFCMKILFTRL